MSIMPSKARKKPVEIEAVQFIPGQYTKGEWLKWCPDANIGVKAKESGEDDLDADEFVWFTINTREGVSYEVPGYAWVLKGVQGEFYPCQRDIFEETYTLTEVSGVNVIAFDPGVVK